MLKIFIFYENFSTMKKIINQVLVNVEETRIIGITNNLNEAISLLRENQADLIITSSADIIDIIKEKFFTYKPNFIIFINKRKTTKSNNEVLYEYYNSNPNRIAKRIKKFIDTSINFSQKEKISIILKKLGFDFKHIGTLYLLDSIYFVRTYKGALSFDCLSKDLYTYIAKINNTNTDRVNWAIVRSINYMYKSHTKSSYKSTLGKYCRLEYPEKPTPKFMINFLAHKPDL